MMPALIPTDHYGTVTWLGAQRLPVENLAIRAEPVAEMPLTLAGFAEESHGGLTRPSCSRVLALHPRGTAIRNSRQLCLVSAEEMAEVASGLGLEHWDHAWVGASVVLSGIPDFSHLPPSSRLQGPDGVTLVVRHRDCARGEEEADHGDRRQARHSRKAPAALWPRQGEDLAEFIKSLQARTAS
jgi:hypothetical protein